MSKEGNDLIKAELRMLLASSAAEKPALVSSIPSTYWLTRLDDGWHPIEELFRENHFHTLWIIFKSIRDHKDLLKHVLEEYCFPLITTPLQSEFCLKFVDSKKITAATMNKVDAFHTAEGDEKERLLRQIEHRLWLIDWEHGAVEEDDEDAACEIGPFLDHLLFLRSSILLQKALQFLLTTKGLGYTLRIISLQLRERLVCAMEDFVFLRIFLSACILPSSGPNLLEALHCHMNWHWKVNQAFDILFKSLQSPSPVDYVVGHKNLCVLKVLGKNGYNLRRDADGKCPMDALSPLEAMEVLDAIAPPPPRAGIAGRSAFILASSRRAPIPPSKPPGTAFFKSAEVGAKRPRGGSAGLEDSRSVKPRPDEVVAMDALLALSHPGRS